MKEANIGITHIMIDGVKNEVSDAFRVD